MILPGLSYFNEAHIRSSSPEPTVCFRGKYHFELFGDFARRHAVCSLDFFLVSPLQVSFARLTTYL